MSYFKFCALSFTASEILTFICLPCKSSSRSRSSVFRMPFDGKYLSSIAHRFRDTNFWEIWSRIFRWQGCLPTTNIKIYINAVFFLRFCAIFHRFRVLTFKFVYLQTVGQVRGVHLSWRHSMANVKIDKAVRVTHLTSMVFLWLWHNWRNWK